MKKFAVVILSVLAVASLWLTGCNEILDDLDTAISEVVSEALAEDPSEEVSVELSEEVMEEESQVEELDTESLLEGFSEEVTWQEPPEPDIPSLSFRKPQYLTEHFEKHGGDFTYANEEEYLQGANRVINTPGVLTKTEKEDGDYVYYLEETNEFVIVSTDGYIRTYFKPSSGRKYFDRQQREKL